MCTQGEVPGLKISDHMLKDQIHKEETEETEKRGEKKGCWIGNFSFQEEVC